MGVGGEWLERMKLHWFWHLHRVHECTLYFPSAGFCTTEQCILRIPWAACMWKKVFKRKQTNQPINKHSEPWGAAEPLINRTTMREIAQTEKKRAPLAESQTLLTENPQEDVTELLWLFDGYVLSGKCRAETLQPELKDSGMSESASSGNIIRFHSKTQNTHSERHLWFKNQLKLYLAVRVLSKDDLYQIPVSQ